MAQSEAEWREYINGLSLTALKEEITREENEQVDRRIVLRELNETIRDLKEQIEAERDPNLYDRIQARRRRIEQLRGVIDEWNTQIEAARVRRDEYQSQVDLLTDGIRAEQARLRWTPFISAVTREIIRQNIRNLSASRAAYRGHTTRQQTLIDRMTGFRQSAIAELGGHTRWLNVEEAQFQRIRRLNDLLRFYVENQQQLELEIQTEQVRIEYKYEVLSKAQQLVRVKIRLYNIVGTGRTPVGMFQGFFIIDGLMDRNGLIDWDWWLTAQEVEIAKYHMVGYFRWGGKFVGPEGLQQATLDDNSGIREPDSRVDVKLKRNGEPYTKNVPIEFVRMAMNMTVEDLILGISSEEPQPTDRPQGVYFDQVIIVDEMGVIKWWEKRDRWVWRPSQAQVERVMRELGRTL